MKARILCITNPKGGCGKSVISTSISAELAGRGHRVALVDADAQGTSIGWARAAPGDMANPVAVLDFSSYAEKIHREIQKQLDNYDFIVVDCPANLESLAPPSVLFVAHLAIIPLPPSPADLWAARGVKKLIEIAQTVNEDLTAVILQNRVMRTSLSQAVMRELENFGIPLMQSRLFNRIAYQEAMIAGVSVSELGRNAKPAADEVRAATDEILTLLEDSK